MQKVAAKDGELKQVYHQRLIEFRKAKESVVRLDKPTNITRARSLGYKAKPGVFTARVRVRRGGGLYKIINKARRPKRKGISKLTRRVSIQRIAEIRAAARFRNAEVVNSYWIGEDGVNKYFEVILADRANNQVLADKTLGNIVQNKGRAQRGLTSAPRKNKVLTTKGTGSENNRPSIRANRRHAK